MPSSFETGRECGPSSYWVTSALQITSIPSRGAAKHSDAISEAQFENNETNTGRDLLRTEAAAVKLVDED